MQLPITIPTAAIVDEDDIEDEEEDDNGLIHVVDAKVICLFVYKVSIYVYLYTFQYLKFV